MSRNRADDRATGRLLSTSLRLSGSSVTDRLGARVEGVLDELERLDRRSSLSLWEWAGNASVMLSILVGAVEELEALPRPSGLDGDPEYPKAGASDIPALIVSPGEPPRCSARASIDSDANLVPCRLFHSHGGPHRGWTADVQVFWNEHGLPVVSDLSRVDL